MEIIKAQFIKVYLVLEGIWNWMDVPDIIVIALKWWLTGGLVAFSIFVITQVVCVVKVILSSDKKEESGVMKSYTEVLALINPSADAPLQRSYLNLIPIVLLGWAGAIYFILFIFNKRYTNPRFKDCDLVFWRRYNYVINFMLIVIVVTYFLSMLIIE